MIFRTTVEILYRNLCVCMNIWERLVLMSIVFVQTSTIICVYLNIHILYISCACLSSKLIIYDYLKHHEVDLQYFEVIFNFVLPNFNIFHKIHI